jgi:electron transfer flavoprotein alpha subunit
MNTLVIAEHDGQHLKTATLNVLTAAKQLAAEITILVVGYECQAVAEQARHFEQVKKVIWVDAPGCANPLAEDLTQIILKLAADFRYILAPATTFGKNFLPRVAALLDVAQISDVVEIISSDTFVHPIYAGNAYQTVQSKDPIGVLTIRTTAFKPAVPTDESAPIESLDYLVPTKQVQFVRQTQTMSKRPELAQARVIVAGGRGLQSKENFALIEALADRLGAAIGASRAAVDAGFVLNDCQIGQTGKVVAPELYIAVGISGAIQHLAGMKDSKIIVAINKDPNAPIFQVADFGLVGDLFTLLPDLCKELDRMMAVPTA